MEFRNKVPALLRIRGLTQQNLSEHLGLTQQQVNDWIRLNKPPTKHITLIRMARYLGVLVDDLIDPTREVHADAEKGPALSPDEERLLRVLRGAGPEATRKISDLIEDLGAETARRRMLMQQGAPMGSGEEVAPIVVKKRGPGGKVRAQDDD